MNHQSNDTIRVELVVVACLGYNNVVHMQGMLEIFVNLRKPYDESSDIIDIENLLRSLEKDGEYKIFSCCCGVPECSGWHKGISVISQWLEIQWVNENTKENWTFERASIVEQLKTVKKEVQFYKAYFQNKDIDYAGVGYNW